MLIDLFHLGHRFALKWVGVTFGLAIGTLVLPQLAQADSEDLPRSFIAQSANKRFQFHMKVGTPSWDESKASGEMFAVMADGSKKSLWKVIGWYTFQVFVPNDGDYLVRMGPWSGGCGATKQDLAVAFYKQGKLVKRYSTADLLKNPKAVECTTDHYEWLHKIEGLVPPNGFELALQTIEKKRLVFDVKTGLLKP